MVFNRRSTLMGVIGSVVALSSVVTGVSLSLAQPTQNCRNFTETGHQVCDKFLTYWDQHGGLAQQGYPISDTFTEVSDLNGKPYTVQYFERAVFELHPENAGTQYEVLLSQLGTIRGKEKYPTGFPASGSVPFYEERTDPGNFMQSFYNAINRKEYQRAYGYYDTGAEKLPYDQFVAGYADTVSVVVYTGKIEEDPGAGNIYATVPTVLVATHTDGTMHTYSGCYILHRTNAGIDPDPNAVLWKLQRGTLTEDKANTPVATLLAAPCNR